MIPDYFEAITAYRVFNVFENGLLAGSAFVEPWPPYEPFVARCGAVSYEGAGEHVRDGRFVSAPVYGCDCGIHVVRTPAAALERVRMERRAHALRLQHLKGPAGRAWGAVKIWGRVIEHESGYRAEFAYPSNLHCDDASSRAAWPRSTASRATTRRSTIESRRPLTTSPRRRRWTTTTTGRCSIISLRRIWGRVQLVFCSSSSA